MQTIEKHVFSRWLRIHHWLNVPFLCLMIWSGVLVYWANDIYPGFFPAWFYNAFALKSRLAEGMWVHFLIGWLFVLNGLGYLIYLALSGHWRELAPSWTAFKALPATVLHDMGLRSEAPPQGKFNAAQRFAYTGVIILAAIGVLTGFAIYKPVQLGWLLNVFGGYEGARGFHFFAMIALVLFIPMHLVQVVRAGWTQSRAIVGFSRVSFAALIAGFVLLSGTWILMRGAEPINDTPKPFRQTLELNGKIWKALFNSNRVVYASSPPKGKIPRANGDIGLAGSVEEWELNVDTDEQNSASRKFTVKLADILKLPRTDMATEFRCIEGWSEDMGFSGVKFSEFMKAYNLEGKRYVGLESSDGEYYVSIDIESMMHEQTLLAYEMNGEPLKPVNGAPLRLVIPVKYGIKNLKHIGKIFFSDERPPDYWEERGYDWYAGL